MTKQEQINEMYNTLKHTGLIEYDEENVEALYNAGYGKMPIKILHVDISEELKKDFFANEIEKVRKETAKEILQTLYNNNERPQFMEVYIKTLADKYGVEVE